MNESYKHIKQLLVRKNEALRAAVKQLNRKSEINFFLMKYYKKTLGYSIKYINETFFKAVISSKQKFKNINVNRLKTHPN